MKEKSVLIVIPARMGSTRLPGKPLKTIAGKPLIEWVIEAAKQVSHIKGIVVATDHQDILKVVNKLKNVKGIMTSSSHKSGTERLIEISKKEKADFYINIQGDEPLIDPKDVELLIENLLNSNSEIVTLAHEIDSISAKEPSNVKVICNQKNEAIYFSRNIIPYGNTSYLQHIGLYGFTKQSLELIEKLDESKLEKLESLEQLRWIDNNLKIKVIMTKNKAIGVDTIQDLKNVEKILMLKKIKVLFSDVDGILTDGKIWYGEKGEQIKAFHSRDGLAIKLLISNGIQFGLISARDSEPLRKRAKDLGIKYLILGEEDKVLGCKKLLQELNINKDNAAYIGDDNIDIPAMEYCGFSFTVKDAVKPVLEKAKLVLKSKGGEGAIREISDLIFDI